MDALDGVLADYDFAGDLTPDAGAEPDPPKAIDAAFYSGIEGAMFARKPEYEKFTAQPVPTTTGPIELPGTHLGERALREIPILNLFAEPGPTQLPGDVLPGDGAQSIADAVDQTPTEPAEGLSLANVADGVNDLPAVHTGKSGDSEVTADVTPGEEPTIAALEAESVELLSELEAEAKKVWEKFKSTFTKGGFVQFIVDLQHGIRKGVLVDGFGGDVSFVYDVASFGVSTVVDVNKEIVKDVQDNPWEIWRFTPLGYVISLETKVAGRAVDKGVEAFLKLREQVFALAEQAGTLYGSIDAAQLVEDAEAIAEAFITQNPAGLDPRQLELFWRVNNLILQVNIEILKVFASQSSPVKAENIGRIVGLIVYEAVVDAILVAGVTAATEGTGTAPLVAARMFTLIKKLKAMGHFTDPIVAALQHGSPLRQKVEALFDALASGKIRRRTDSLPFGFFSAEEFGNFGKALQSRLAKGGYEDVQALLQGSAVTGVRARSKSPNIPAGTPFDALKQSDFDVALISPKLFSRAKELNIPVRGGGTRTAPLIDGNLYQLGIEELPDELIKMLYKGDGRSINFMIFDTIESALKRGPSIRIPGE